MSATVEERLALLEARAEITDLVARYALGADRRNDPAIMGRLFAADASWSADGFGVLRGREAIAEGLAAIAAEKVLWSIHFMVAPVIAIATDGRSGTCQWYLWELCTMQAEAGPQDQWLGGWYDGTVTLTEDGWKLRSVVLHIRVQGEIAPALFFKKRAEG
ncbi:nuclear transport factor 2 family protein [Sphingobium terrigena]|uniref:Nuclear transport factor 2 family protein n=1 Tax=Sphingobium terrigena TaxID=2304063 RepID=A0A418YUP1_9SPHN|nr:nuclear transport factor 2 family protein [Sphingobium terrigena]RJG55884.1 nuclear transport factor 2 family protein [Sphingobium terrigena]